MNNIINKLLKKNIEIINLIKNGTELEKFIMTNYNNGILRISTYNYYTSEEFTKFIQNKKLKIMIGLTFSECNPGCEHCLKKNNNKKYFSNLLNNRLTGIKFSEKLHLKYISFNNYVIIGGINLTGSGWTDLSIVIKCNENLFNEFNDIFDNYYQNIEESDIKINYVEPILEFGKYKGRSIKEVSKIDLNYIKWLKTIKINQGLVDEIKKLSL